MSERKPNILQRLNEVMKEVRYLQKAEKRINDQYRAVTHDMVTAKVHDPFVKHGIFPAFRIKSRVQNGNRTEIDACVTFINIDDPNDRIEVDSVGYGVDSQDKGPGKAISYAYKYAILKALCVETGDDPDLDQNAEFNGSDFTPVSAPIAAPKTTDLGKVISFVKGRADLESQIKQFNKVQNLHEMTPDQLQRALKWLEQQRNVRNAG